MPNGTVKKIITDKGFGFITPDEGQGDLFFHHSACAAGQFDTLQQGQHVQYEVDDTGDKGPKAKNVTALAA